MAALALNVSDFTWAQSVPRNPNQEATLGFVGDVLPHKLVRASASRFSEEQHGGFVPVAEQLRSLASAVDFAVFNMESPVVDAPLRALEKMRFWAPPDLPGALHDVGFDAASCANNHSFDQGRIGLAQTRAHLLRLGLQPLGCGTEEEAARPYVVSVHGIRVALVAFTAVLNGDIERTARGDGTTALLWIGDGASVRHAVASARSAADYVVVVAHWDREYRYVAQQATRDIARAVFTAGADLIVGQHPHVLQPAETWHIGTRTVHVIFSLGNAVSEMGFGEGRDSLRDTRLSAFARVELRRSARGIDARLSFVPLWSRHGQRCVNESPTREPGICVQPGPADDGTEVGQIRASLIRTFMGPHADGQAPRELFSHARDRRAYQTRVARMVQGTTTR